VRTIAAMGGEAVANDDDIADFEGAGRLVKFAIDRFGGLDRGGEHAASSATRCSRARRRTSGTPSCAFT